MVAESEGAAAMFDALSGDPLPSERAGRAAEVPAGMTMVSGPALFDPQINGFAGVDFQSADLTVDGVEHAVSALRDAGCSHLLPTVITGSVDRMEAQFATLAAAAGNGRVVDGIQQSLFIFEAGDVHLQSLPADYVHRVEFQSHRTVIIHLYQVDASLARLVGMTALGVSGVDDGRPLLTQHLPGVDMSQRPVVHAGFD